MGAKKVLIVISSFGMGGTMSSLYSLLSILDKRKVSVDLFSLVHDGEYYGRLPNCRLLDENVWLSYSIVHKVFFSKVIVKLLWLIRKVLEPLKVDMFSLYGYIGGKQIHSDKYDAIIGFDEGLARIISKYPAKRRINWIHCDYRRFAKGSDESNIYKNIDAIVCVSEFARKIFSDIYPQFSDKVYSIHNAININDIQNKSVEPVSDSRFNNEKYTIVSCGRLDPVKQFSKIPLLASNLKKIEDMPFVWYIIGGGEKAGEKAEEDLINREILKHRVTDCVVMLGMKTNIYPFLSKSDLYVSTSSSESFPMVVNEAKALFIPIISNDFPSVYESVRDGIDGYVCTLDNIPKYISKQMHQPLEITKDNYRNENEEIIAKFLNLLKSV